MGNGIDVNEHTVDVNKRKKILFLIVLAVLTGIILFLGICWFDIESALMDEGQKNLASLKIIDRLNMDLTQLYIQRGLGKKNYLPVKSGG